MTYDCRVVEREREREREPAPTGHRSANTGRRNTGTA